MTNSPKCAAAVVTDCFLEVTTAALGLDVFCIFNPRRYSIYVSRKNQIPFSNAVHSVSSTISEYTVNPGSDLTRDRKLPAEKLITFLVSQGASSSKNELLDFFDMDPQAPTASALNQQRAKLRPEALEMVFRHFNSLTDSLDGTPSDYRFIAADGSTFTFFSKPSFSPSEYYVSGALDTYKLSFRIVRFEMSDGSYECIVTNLPAGEFPPERIKEIYFTRWESKLHSASSNIQSA